MSTVKISELPAGTAAANAIVPATNAAGTTTEKVTCQSIANLAPVSSVAGRTGAVTLAVGDVTNAVATNDSRLTDTRTPTDGSVTTAKLADDAVTYAKLQNISATDRLLGRSSAGAGDAEEIVCTSAGRALLDDADAAAQRSTLGLSTVASTGLASDLSGTLSDARLTTQVRNAARLYLWSSFR